LAQPPFEHSNIQRGTAMDLSITIMGHRCDLALHPISPNSASIIHRLGRDLYKKKYLEWWRQGRTCTCGVKYDSACSIAVSLGGTPQPYNAAVVGDAGLLHKNRLYIDTKVQYLALLGYDDEYCQTRWVWRNVEAFEPEKLEFIVHRWDQILDAQDYLIIEDMTYDGCAADEEVCGKSQGFNLVDPKVINLSEVRRELAMPMFPMGDYSQVSRVS